ncbi:DUF7736 domain-containing protein [Amycolatopsis thermoflava]|uniref:DUF7736 domain-containing protein n=1 Tax=Amycolatopsis thermoflava TaxID=84480 RepID=UPI0004182C08|nr:hypothetical protein [Amycolatopsis thermoflava]
MTSNRFHLGDLLTIATGQLLSPRGLPGVQQFVDHVTGQSHLTHQIPRAIEETRPFLLQQHPWLAGITVPAGLDTEANVTAWLKVAGERYGEWHEVEPMPAVTSKPPLGDIEATRAWLATRPAQPATVVVDTLPDSVWVVAVEFAGSRNPVAATGTPERAELVATALAHYETTQPGVLFAHLAATTGAVPTAWPDLKEQQ